MICRFYQGKVTWDIQRSMFAKRPAVFLLTRCLNPKCRAFKKWRRFRLGGNLASSWQCASELGWVDVEYTEHHECYWWSGNSRVT